jgi:hypothetical protein
MRIPSPAGIALLSLGAVAMTACSAPCAEVACLVRAAPPVTLNIRSSEGGPVDGVELTGVKAEGCGVLTASGLTRCFILPPEGQGGAGAYTFTVTAPGFVPVQRSVEVRPDLTPSCCEGPYVAETVELTLSRQ